MPEMRLAFPRPTRFILGLMIALGAIWVLLAILYQVTAFGPGLYQALVLDPAAVVGQGRVWTLLSYVVVNSIAAPLSLIFPLIVVYFFGSDLQLHWGTARFAWFLVLTTLGGAALTMVAWLAGLPGIVAAGTSSFGAALCVAWGLTYPQRRMFLVFFPLSGRHLVWVTVGFAVLSAIAVTPSGAAADFGAMGTAAALVLGLWRTNKMRLLWDNLLVALRVRRRANLHVVPKPSKYDIN